MYVQSVSQSVQSVQQAVCSGRAAEVRWSTLDEQHDRIALTETEGGAEGGRAGKVKAKQAKAKQRKG